MQSEAKLGLTLSWAGAQSNSKASRRPFVDETVRLGTALAFSRCNSRSAGNWFAPPDGNRSRLFLGNEKAQFSSNFPPGSRAVYNTRAST
jgi:hypothetical protein